MSVLIGSEASAALEQSRVIVFGLGGVGSWCAEALVRSGIGSISLVDSDVVCASNINRQVEALGSTLGRLKAEVLEERLKDINPSCHVKCFTDYFSLKTVDVFDIPGADYVIDAIDTIPHKLDLIETSCAAGRRLFSSMGMAQKLDPTLIRTADIWKTSCCPLAKIVRRGLQKRNFTGHFTAVYSTERPSRLTQPPRPPWLTGSEEISVSAAPAGSGANGGGKEALGSVVTVTATAGMVLANLVIQDICARISE